MSAGPPENSSEIWERFARGGRSRGALGPTTSLEPSSDQALALEAAAGSRAAFSLLVERYAGRVVAVLERQLGDHHAALDIGQEVWIRVHRALPRYRPGHSFRSWLFAIALNAARDEGRRRQRSRVVYVEEFSDPQGVERRAVPPAESALEESPVEQALARVPEPYRTAVTLVDVEGLSYEEAAESADCALGTMKSRVARGRAAFRDAWVRIEGGGQRGAEGAAGVATP